MIGVFAMLGQMFPDLLQFVVFNMVKQDVVGGREVKQVEGEEDQMVDPRVDHQKWRHDPGGSCVICHGLVKYSPFLRPREQNSVEQRNIELPRVRGPALFSQALCFIALQLLP